MTLFAPPVGSRSVNKINPVSKLIVSAVISLAVLLSLDWVSATVALALECVLIVWVRLSPRQLVLSTSPVWIAAILSGFTILLYGRPSGQVYFHFFVAQVTDGSIELAIATVLRGLAIGLPAVVLFVTIDPTDFADGLAQVMKLPARFVLGALAGFRLVFLLLEDWRSLERARRARGVADTGRLRRFAGQALALLVISIRRGTKLATAMEARGFGGKGPRTWARPSRMRIGDAVVIAYGVLIAASAVTVAVLSGHWSFIGG
ncbi:MAG: energy-coupling factor transporter transmembrane protein EcfT [Salinibacterium sp.]|nr:MAG: energy-coupling factor transporter transmembrane protein EcfT [Salinibacterium sp.]